MNNNVTTLKEIFMNTENEIASAIIKAANLLGNGGADTPMGAIEALGKVHKEGLAEIADSLHEGLAEIADSLREIASAINTVQGEASQ
jgi:hypothetical protein